MRIFENRRSPYYLTFASPPIIGGLSNPWPTKWLDPVISTQLKLEYIQIYSFTYFHMWWSDEHAVEVRIYSNIFIYSFIFICWWSVEHSVNLRKWIWRNVYPPPCTSLPFSKDFFTNFALIIWISLIICLIHFALITWQIYKKSDILQENMG